MVYESYIILLYYYLSGNHQPIYYLQCISNAVVNYFTYEANKMWTPIPFIRQKPTSLEGVYRELSPPNVY